MEQNHRGCTSLVNTILSCKPSSSAPKTFLATWYIHHTYVICHREATWVGTLDEGVLTKWHKLVLKMRYQKSSVRKCLYVTDADGAPRSSGIVRCENDVLSPVRQLESFNYWLSSVRHMERE